MKTLVLFLVSTISVLPAAASDSLEVTVTKKSLVAGDTLEFRCAVPGYASLNLANATLNVWIDDLSSGKRWKFRYPMIRGEVAASLAVSDKIPQGNYAVNFLVQRGFFRMSGRLRNPSGSDTVINYIMIRKNGGAPYIDKAHVSGDGSFRLKSTLFADSAFFVFTPARKTKNNNFFITAETPLDSAFIPVLQQTRFITVGNAVAADRHLPDSSGYRFAMETDTSGTLPGVVVTGKFKKLVEQYNEEFSSGLFNQQDAIMFDGLDSKDIANAADVISFLQGRVPGLSVMRDETGAPYATWRQKPVDIYIDEFQQQPGDPVYITTSEIAMIKVYRPPAMLSGHTSDAGAIAIYTKRGRYFDEAGARTRHNFIVHGYTNVDAVWK